jgi:pimeloyl-ACP methyl ester carboxylesterase
MVGLATQVNPLRVDTRDFDLYLRQVAEINPELFLGMLHAANQHDATDVLPTIQVPSLFLAGAADDFIPLKTIRTAAFSIPGSRLRSFDSATHALPAEFPAEVAKEIETFAAELESP